jgi:hypothetical protein
MSEQINAPSLCSHYQSATHLAVIEQAVGVLMDWYELPPAQADCRLRSWAAQCEVPPCQVAEALANGVCLGRAHGCQVTVVRQLEQLLRELPATLQA